jgi:hypothetical protein
MPAVFAAVAVFSACGDPSHKGRDLPDGGVTYTEMREPCRDRVAMRKVFWGDLHSHSMLSWDAYGYGSRVTPLEAYRFARGEKVLLPPLDAGGKGTREISLSRPLDFAALTDHHEYIGEMTLCTTPGSAVYDLQMCRDLRAGGQGVVTRLGLKLAEQSPARFKELCGEDGAVCVSAAAGAWKQITGAAETVYDRTAECAFTSFIGYEYTASTDAVNFHRNVIFRNDAVPVLPPSYFEQGTAEGLWGALDEICPGGGNGLCDMMVIPHNSNWSNGNMYRPETLTRKSLEAKKAHARLRARNELVAEIFQHKGDQECMNGFDGIETDQMCGFEKIHSPDFDDCGNDTGIGGVNGLGCVSRYDFLRSVWSSGLMQKRTLGFNPSMYGVIASTDTHNGTPGYVSEPNFMGHVGTADDTPAKRLGHATITHNTRVYNPAGLAAVWAEERSRDAIFGAVKRRETYATSGPRMAVRVFGGTGYGAGICALDDKGFAEKGYSFGVPMGGVLKTADLSGAAPSFAVRAEWDKGVPGDEGVGLQQIQIVKLWLDSNGAPKFKVFTVAGDPGAGMPVDTATCVSGGSSGVERLCAVWQDPGFDSLKDAVYYARVLEVARCRWAAYDCNAMGDSRPAECTDGTVPVSVQERAWTSPIWYEAL